MGLAAERRDVQPRASGLGDIADAPALVARKVIQDHHLTGPERRRKDVPGMDAAGPSWADAPPQRISVAIPCVRLPPPQSRRRRAHPVPWSGSGVPFDHRGNGSGG
ncbi:hypothetical protein LNKW23_10920 [Paralimibaculum aggregatum]|uniref:Uncharacterized protein n=1 Tax=Paralimibaculum aggregatum TaxID=3036245 RepID=A0ABQ6LIA2_9RHOB|nr:hypothetical protein LNKW23_10920 [Limibaculum sp. NKW23]